MLEERQPGLSIWEIVLMGSDQIVVWNQTPFN